ncbi:unnamed protein product, partial [Coregonus sp. 'balchen']
MNCSHTKGSDYYQMYWYRQRPGEGMKQVVFTSSYSKPDYGAFGEDKYPTVKTDAETGSFTVKKVEAGDSGMYFCAVSEHSLVEGSEVTQTPTILWGLKDSDAQMNCSHTKGATYNQMYWYRQRPGEGMKQVVFTSSYSKPDYGAFGEDKYPTVKTDAESGSFTVKKVEAGDSGMYFCAVSEHSDTDDKHSCTKTPEFQ